MIKPDFQHNSEELLSHTQNKAVVLKEVHGISELLKRMRQRRKFRKKSASNGKSLPSVGGIKYWYSKFLQNGYFSMPVKRGQKGLGQDIIQRISDLFTDNPETSIRSAAQQLPVSYGSVQKSVRKYLKMYPYKIQVLQLLKEGDYEKRLEFADTMVARINQNPRYLETVCFSDEATFHVSGRVHRHNVRIWGKTNPHVFREHERDSPKVNVWAAMFHNQVIGPFFFRGKNYQQDELLSNA